MNRNRSTNIITDNQRERNIETRFANRMQSIFSAVGQIVNDFYLEIGIYCIGLLNAALVAWSIYTDLLSDNQPLLYAVALGVIALIAVEGLAVYLVGAAAKTNNGWLWFFSVVFATFFTLAHSYGSKHISHYITWAIPFFVVIGYWARTLKNEKEREERKEREQELKQEEELQKIEQERKEREQKEKDRVYQLEDEERQFNRQLELEKIAKKQELALAKIEAKKDKIDGQNGSFLPNNDQKLAIANQAKKDKINHRRKQLLTLVNSEDLTQKELAERLGVSLGTIKNDLKSLNGSVK